MRHFDNRCEIAPEQIAAYLGDVLDPTTRVEIEEHLVQCSQCQSWLANSAQQVRELTCRELVELVTAYFDDRLAPHDRARFERHLAGCEECQAYLSQMRQTIRLLGTLAEETISPSTQEALLRLFRGGF